jgi:hypothetical protein
MKKARAAEARLRTLTKTYGIVPDSGRAVQVASVQAVAQYGSVLWWDPREVGRRDDLQLLLNQQAKYILGALPTTQRGAVKRESWLTPAPVAIDYRQQRFAPRLENACSSKRKKIHNNPYSGAPVCRVVWKHHEHCRTIEAISCSASGGEPAVRTTILDDTAAAKRAAQCWAREKEAKIRAAVWRWGTDGSRSEDGRVVAAALCKQGNE